MRPIRFQLLPLPVRHDPPVTHHLPLLPSPWGYRATQRVPRTDPGEA